VTKIEAGQPHPDSFGSQPPEQTTADNTSETGCQGNGPETDSVRLAPDDPPTGTAVQEPAAPPAIRQVKVEAARKAIDAGTIGTDPQALADKIIESMLKK
jgi:flagellar biosynthesis anti-sigma factor FlgM